MVAMLAIINTAATGRMEYPFTAPSVALTVVLTVVLTVALAVVPSPNAAQTENNEK